LDLPAPVRAEEAPKLLFTCSGPPLGLSLENAERLEFALGIDDPFHGGNAESANQLVLQVGDAHVEPEALHRGPREVGAKAGSLETTPEVTLLRGVAEPSNFQVKPLRTEPIEEAADVRRTPHRLDRNALGIQLPTAAPCQRFERELVADAFDKDDRTPGGVQAFAGLSIEPAAEMTSSSPTRTV